jgi:dolichol kinase
VNVVHGRLNSRWSRLGRYPKRRSPLTHVAHIDERELVLDLHRLLVNFDPSRWGAEMRANLAGCLAKLKLKLVQFQRSVPRPAPYLSDLRELLDQDAPRDLARWTDLHRRLQVAYEDLRSALNVPAEHAPALRSTRYRRSLVHVAIAVLTLVLAEMVLPGWAWKVSVAGLAAGLCWSAEIARRVYPPLNDWLMQVVGNTAHPHERSQVNSATWYATAIVLLALVAPPVIVTVAIAVLGIGDPIAGLVGRRWGRVQLMHGRTLIGTSAFIVAATLASGVALSLWHPGLGLNGWGLALAAATAGAIAELVAQRIDDNLAVPLAAATGALIWAVTTGLPIF